MFDDVQTLHYFVHTYQVTGETVTFRINNFFEIYFVIYTIRYPFAHVASPTRSTSCTSCTAERDSIFTTQHSYTFHTALGNDITCKYVVVFVNDSSHIRDKFFHPFDKIRVKVSLHTANRVVIHNQASAASFLKNIENLFTVTESVEESCQRSEVHGKGGKEQ